MLTAGVWTEFLNFLQIFFWVALPLLLSAAAITTFFHYRRRRSKSIGVDLPADLLLPFSVPSDLPPIPADHALKASLNQISMFRSSLITSNARYSVLKKDLDRLEAKYNELLKTKTIEQPETSTDMVSLEVTNELRHQLDQLNETYTTEKKDLIRKYEELEQHYADASAELHTKEHQDRQLQSLFEEKNAEISTLKQAVHERDEHIHKLFTQLENSRRVISKLNEEMGAQHEVSLSCVHATIPASS